MTISTEAIENSAELVALKRGTVIVSPNYMDAYSRFDWGSGGTLMNVATGHKTSPADIGSDFFPATVIHSYSRDARQDCSRLAGALDAVLRLCAITDTETSENQQAWLVDAIRDAIENAIG